MDYFSKFLRPGNDTPKNAIPNHAQIFQQSWLVVEETLLHPDERQLAKGIRSSDVPNKLQSMVDSLVGESAQLDDGTTGACMEYLLKNDVLGSLVKLSEADRPFGAQAEVLSAIRDMVVLLGEQFLVHSAVHKAILRLLKNCIGDDIKEQLDGHKLMGAAGNTAKSRPSEYEEDLVNLLCILCSRIRSFRELLIIFFHDKSWHRSEETSSENEEEEGEGEEEDEDEGGDDSARAYELTEEMAQGVVPEPARPPSPSSSMLTIKSAPNSSGQKKIEYEFLLLNYILRFVHREGTIGDSARAGLLFIMDIAMSPAAPTGHGVQSTEHNIAPDPMAEATLSLAAYILEGDFSEVLGAGLAAVYSLLPTKLDICPLVASGASLGTGMVIGGTGYESDEQAQTHAELSWASGKEESNNPDFKARLDHFLKVLHFIQDILRCNLQEGDDGNSHALTPIGNDIAASILNAVRQSFFENVLYPSILECSDADGSAVAVMSYIEVMLSKAQGRLIDTLVDFLMSEDNTQLEASRRRQRSIITLGDTPPRIRTRTISKKSAAMTLLELEAPDSTKKSEYFTSMGRFTLKDLLISSLRSQSQRTSASALQLLQTMLLKQCRVSVDRLLVVIYDPYSTSFPEPALLLEVSDTASPSGESDDAFVFPTLSNAGMDSTQSRPSRPSLFVQPTATVSTHEQEMDLYRDLIARVAPAHDDNALSTGFDRYLLDALQALQSQRCFLAGLELESRREWKHILNPNDPILTLVLEALRMFFANTPEFNIALTGVFATLALCPDRSIAGWLTISPDPRSNPMSDTFRSSQNEAVGDGDDRSLDSRSDIEVDGSERPPTADLNDSTRPIVYSILLGLVNQLERYKQTVDDFDKYLLERRQGLLFSENLTDALTISLESDTSNFFPTKTTAPPAAGSPDRHVHPKKKQTFSSSFRALLTPKKSKPSTPVPPDNDALAKGLTGGRVDASPFGPHYEHTRSISLEPFVAPVPPSGTWTSIKSHETRIAPDEDVFTSTIHWGDSRGSLGFESSTGRNRRSEESVRESTAPKRVTLSHLLDNVVVLEESIKELMAIIQARRSLGIDALRYF